MSPLCSNPRCRIPNRHLGICADADCRGCLRAWAADGLALCQRCTVRIGLDAVELARLWGELGEVLVASGATGTIVVRNPHPGIKLNAAAVQIRREIGHTLGSWAGYVSETRGLRVPLSLRGLGTFVSRSAQWLAACELAADVADELADLRGRAWATAYPEPVSVIDVGSCPETDQDGQPCQGTVQARMRPADSLLPSRVVCTHDPGHEWTAPRWRTLGRSLNARAAACMDPVTVAAEHGLPIQAVYRMANEFHWTRIRDGRRVLYVTADVLATLGQMPSLNG